MSSPRTPLTRNESLHNQVARNIRNDVEAGVLKDGDVLPSTRELAKEWGVSVFTINEAMKLLAKEGLVVSKSRSKRVVQSAGHVSEQKIRPRAPHALLIGGYAGSGKTELGRIIARQTGWPLLDKDTLTRPVVETALEALGHSPNDRESSEYTMRIRPREYEALMAAAVENVECGNSAIVTAPFLREFGDPAWVHRTEANFAALGARTSLVWIYCEPETMHAYVRHRGAARDAAKLADWNAWLASIDLKFRPAGVHTLVDNSASSMPLQTQAKDLIATISALEP